MNAQSDDSEFKQKSESAVKALPNLQLGASAPSTSAGAAGGDGVGTPGGSNTPSHSPQVKPVSYLHIQMLSGW